MPEAVVFSVDACAALREFVWRLAWHLKGHYGGNFGGELEFRRVMPTSVSVIGLGKLGAPMAAAIAARGVLAIGVDAAAPKGDTIAKSLPPAFYPPLRRT